MDPTRWNMGRVCRRMETAMQCEMRGFCLEAGYGALRRPMGNEARLLWEWLPATIPSRQDAAPTEKQTTSVEDKNVGKRRWMRRREAIRKACPGSGSSACTTRASRG